MDPDGGSINLKEYNSNRFGGYSFYLYNTLLKLKNY